MTGWVRGDSDGRDSMGGVIVDSLDLRATVEVVLLGINGLRGRMRRCVTDPDAVLNQPLVDSLGRMGHKNPASEVGLRQDVGKRRGMVNVKTCTFVSVVFDQTVPSAMAMVARASSSQS